MKYKAGLAMIERYLPKGVGTKSRLHSQSLPVESKMKTSHILMVNHNPVLS